MPIDYIGPHTVSKELFTEQLIKSPPPVVGFDVETISLKERMPLGFSIATSPIEAWYFKTYPELDKEIELVLPLLQNPKIKKVLHNCLFDLRAIPIVAEVDSSNIADTNVMARLCGRTETKLFELAPEVGMEVTPVNVMIGPGQTMLDVPPEKLGPKCMRDSMATLALYYHYLDQIDPEYFRVETDVIPILLDMSLRGMKVNQEDRAKIETQLETDVAFYKNLCAEEDFNPASNQQVGYILAKRGNFLPFTRSRTRRQLKVNEEQLEFLDDPLAAAVLNFRKANKLLTTYIRPLAGQDRMYTEYNLEAVVGRISSSNMNMQNIPPSIRYMYMPDSGVFTTGDFSQEHLRIIMHYSGDRQMQRVYYEGEMGGDIHSFTAKELGISRKFAKVINFAIPYGATPKTVSIQAKIKDLRKCSMYLDRWFDIFRDSAEWIREAQEHGLRTGWSLPTLFGRSIKLPEEYGDNPRYRKSAEEAIKRKAVNYPIIGSDGEIMKRALILCKHLPLIATVHDSITLDGEVEFPIEQLETISPVRIPFVVKRSKRWE